MPLGRGYQQPALVRQSAPPALARQPQAVTQSPAVSEIANLLLKQGAAAGQQPVRTPLEGVGKVLIPSLVGAFLKKEDSDARQEMIRGLVGLRGDDLLDASLATGDPDLAKLALGTRITREDAVTSAQAKVADREDRQEFEGSQKHLDRDFRSREAQRDRDERESNVRLRSLLASEERKGAAADQRKLAELQNKLETSRSEKLIRLRSDLDAIAAEKSRVGGKEDIRLRAELSAAEAKQQRLHETENLRERAKLRKEIETDLAKLRGRIQRTIQRDKDLSKFKLEQEKAKLNHSVLPQGKGVEATDRRNLMMGAQLMAKGTPGVIHDPDIRLAYNTARQVLAKGGGTFKDAEGNVVQKPAMDMRSFPMAFASDKERDTFLNSGTKDPADPKVISEGLGREYPYEIGRTGGFATSVTDAQDKIDGLEKDASFDPQEAAVMEFVARGTLGESLKGLALSPQQQRYIQAKWQFIEAALRRASGAAIKQSEFEMWDRIYFPQVGDDVSTIEQKRMARLSKERELHTSAGMFLKNEDPEIYNRYLSRREGLNDEFTSLIGRPKEDIDRALKRKESLSDAQLDDLMGALHYLRGTRAGPDF